MAILDPERERQRLREECSRMLDGELEAIAVAQADLTDVATLALREEMSCRGLPFQAGSRPAAPGGQFSQVAPPETPASPDADFNIQSADLSVARRFASFAEALVAQGLLESAGIPCFLADENVLGANPFFSNAFGGVRLFVKKSSLEEAVILLNGPVPNEIEVQGVGKYVQPRCPQCSSFDITFGELNNAAKASLPLGIPLPIRPNEWLCHNCGCRWTDSEA